MLNEQLYEVSPLNSGTHHEPGSPRRQVQTHHSVAERTEKTLPKIDGGKRQKTRPGVRKRTAPQSLLTGPSTTGDAKAPLGRQGCTPQADQTKRSRRTLNKSRGFHSLKKSKSTSRSSNYKCRNSRTKNNKKSTSDYRKNSSCKKTSYTTTTSKTSSNKNSFRLKSNSSNKTCTSRTKKNSSTNPTRTPSS